MSAGGARAPFSSLAGAGPVGRASQPEQASTGQVTAQAERASEAAGCRLAAVGDVRPALRISMPGCRQSGGPRLRQTCTRVAHVRACSGPGSNACAPMTCGLGARDEHFPL